MKCFSDNRYLISVITTAVLIFLSTVHPSRAAEASQDDIDYENISHYALKPGVNVIYADSIIDRESIIDVGTTKQLFIDDMLIESSHGITLTINPPYQTGELLITNDQPWEIQEKARIHPYANVIQEGDKIRIWYGLFTKLPYLPICYAESTDGIHFTKPILNLHEVNGSKANNIVIAGPDKEGITQGGPAVWIDPKAPPHQRYKT